jgi:disulfide bond formation protein DsbB
MTMAEGQASGIRLDASVVETRLAIAIAAIGAATLIGAWIFQYGFGLVPCPLCLEQRYAYYLSIPLAALVALAASKRVPGPRLAVGFAILALAAAANTVFGSYHAGVEWGWWQGPTTCSGTPMLDLGSGDLLKRLETVRVVACDQVQWRFLGLSLAGYNALISLVIAALALLGVRSALRQSA